MFSAARAAPLTRSGPRPLPIALSVVTHAVILSLVHFGPRVAAPPKPRSLYDEVIRPHEHELVWYSFSRKLPDVSPPQSQSQQPPATEMLSSDQTIISNPKQADRGLQMIWRPTPQIQPQPPVASPNILAFQRPLLPPPPKLFVPPPAQPTPTTAPVLTAPPALQASSAAKLNSLLTTDVSSVLAVRPKPRDFVPPVPLPEKPTVPVALPEAPSISTSLRSNRVPLLAEAMAAPLADKPQPRQFVPPATRERPASAPVPLPEAPQLSGHIGPAVASGNPALQNGSAAALANKPEPRKFVAPGANAAAGKSGNAAPSIAEAPSPDLAGLSSAGVDVAIVGLNPAAKLIGPLPEASRDARFSAGPNGGGSTGGADPAANSALSVPGLLVRGGPPQNAPDITFLARAAPTSREMLEAAMKLQGNAPRTPESPASEIHLAPPPAPEFNGRDVYTLAVQMPNITSYVGSWIMWFADRERRPASWHSLRPPVPLHKVDPKYPPDAISERIEGKVQIAGVIRTNGRVDLLRILKGVDPRLDSSAQEALMKWEFAPAERYGVPVEVDVVAEIPFLLAPQTKR